MKKPYKPQCEYWQWLVDEKGNETVARCTHPRNSGGDCKKSYCPMKKEGEK